MSFRGCVCVFICVFFCCAVRGNTKRVYNIQELTVTGKDLKDCGKQKKVCVMSRLDCPVASDLLTAEPESFVNTSCHFLAHEESFTCRWTRRSDVPEETVSSFIFRRADDVVCPGIIHLYSSFNLTIKSKSVNSRREQFSDVYPVILEDIVQAPRPVITSVNVTESSVNVTWNSGKITATKCRIRYKRLSTESWTETAGFPASDESLFVIEGLQAFSEYRLSVSCCHELSRWSDWSVETRVKTSESPPSASLSLSYCVAPDGSSGVRRLLLLWKALDVTEARGLIRRYEVSYMPIKQPSLKRTIQTSELKAVVPVAAQEYEVTAWAVNGAGDSPLLRLRVDASRSHDVRALKALWVHPDGAALRILWERDVSAGNVSEFAIEWSGATNRDRKLWRRVAGSASTARLTGIDANETYGISVFPVRGSLCGAPTSISADLQRGALLDLLRFRLVKVTRSSVEVEWTWKEAKPKVAVLRYRLVLEGAHRSEYLTVFPGKQQHSFQQLQANSKYSVYIQAETATGNFSKASLDVSTPLLDYEEMMRFAVPVALLLLVFGILSVSSRTVFRGYFFPIVANPRYSLIGRWLLNPHLKGSGEICVMKLESLFPFEQQEKSLVQVERRVSLGSEHEDVRTSGDAALWKPHAPSSPPEYVDLPLLADNSDYVQTGQMSTIAQLSEKTSD